MERILIYQAIWDKLMSVDYKEVCIINTIIVANLFWCQGILKKSLEKTS